MFKRIVALLLTLILASGVLSALAEDDLTTIGNTKSNKIKLKKSYADNPVVEGVSSTTGLPASGEVYTPILIVIDNAEDAHPHWGIGDADIMFQIPNAGAGATKLLALFGDHYPEAAGGVRSARSSMVPVAKAWDATFAYAGAPDLGSVNASPEYLMRRFGMTKTNRSYSIMGHFGQREKFMATPHNMSCMVRQLHDELISKGVTYEQRPFLFTDEPRTDGEAAEFIQILHRGDNPKNNSNHASAATYTYDFESDAYVRANSKGDFIDRLTGAPILFRNLIVVRTRFVWSGNYVSLKDNLVGSGVAEVFQNGRYVRGAWFRDSQDDRLVFIGPDGKELPMQRGKSFIIITNDVTEVSYR